MKNNRKELSIGLGCIALALVLIQFTSTSCFIMGILIGLGLLFELIGTLPEKNYIALKELKKSIFKMV